MRISSLVIALAALLALSSPGAEGSENRRARPRQGASRPRPPGALVVVVSDSLTGRPLAGASVHVRETRRGTIVNDEGVGTVAELTPGLARVQVLLWPYRLKVDSVVVRPGLRDTLRFFLVESDDRWVRDPRY